MSWTKGQIIEEAFGVLALAGFVYDLSPDEKQSALRRLDTMMASWEAKGVRIGYAFPGSPDGSDPSDDSGVPDGAIEALYTNLAVRQAGAFGKQLPADTLRAARETYDTLTWAAAQPIEQQLPSTMPRGAGNRIWRNSQRPFFPRPDDDPLRITQGGDMSVQPE